MLKEDIPPSEMESLCDNDLMDDPIIAISDIISYDAQTHEMELSDLAYERISKLELPMSGKTFLVYVDNIPIYWGAFMTPISSYYYEGVTIMFPLGSLDPNKIKISLGYPSQSSFLGIDPRNRPEIMASLKKSGILVNEP